MSRFYAPKKNIKGNLIYIDGQEARHILNVMRLNVNDKVTVFDGSGKEYAGFIKTTRPKSLTVEIIQTKIPKPEKLPTITLAQSIPKKQKMDYIIEKSTELGINNIIPIISERVTVRLNGEKAVDRVERWQKIAFEASKQCGRTDVPKINTIQKFYNAIDNISDYDLSFMACLSDDTIPLREAISEFKRGRIIVFIGPEGDFTPEEIQMAKDANCKFVSLGNRVLKSDTAGLYVLSALNYEFSSS